jgi:hypothetical protein
VSETTKPLADRLFECDRAEMTAEDELFTLLETIGFGDSWADWGRDAYDSSLELYGVPPEARLTEEGAAKLHEAGFWIVWLNHTDGSETTYSDRSKGSTRQTDGHRARSAEECEMKKLRRRIADPFIDMTTLRTFPARVARVHSNQEAAKEILLSGKPIGVPEAAAIIAKHDGEELAKLRRFEESLSTERGSHLACCNGDHAGPIGGDGCICSPYRLDRIITEKGQELESLRRALRALEQFKKRVDIAMTAGLLGMSGEVGFKLPCHQFVTSLKVAFRQAESEYMSALSSVPATPQQEISPKLDSYADGGWGMKIDPSANVGPEEALQLAKEISKQRKDDKGDNDA